MILLDYYIMFVTVYDLESDRAADREPVVSVPDPIEADVKDINMLRLLGVPPRLTICLQSFTVDHVVWQYLVATVPLCK